MSLDSPVALDNNTLPRRSGGREQTGGSRGGCGEGWLKKRKLDEMWRKIQLSKFIFTHLQLFTNLNSSSCLAISTDCFKGQDLNKDFGPNSLFFI